MKKVLNIMFVFAVCLTFIGLCADPQDGSNFYSQLVLGWTISIVSAMTSYVLYKVIHNYEAVKAFIVACLVVPYVNHIRIKNGYTHMVSFRKYQSKMYNKYVVGKE